MQHKQFMMAFAVLLTIGAAAGIYFLVIMGNSSSRTLLVADNHTVDKSAQPNKILQTNGTQAYHTGAQADSRATETRPNNEIGQLRRENEQLRAQLTDILNWILANFRGRYPVLAEHIDRLHLRAVREDFTIHPEVAEFMNISPEEEAVINDAFAYANSVLKLLEEENMYIASEHEGELSLHIAAFPEDGERLREELYKALEVALGGYRFDRFMDVSHDGLEDGFNRFGQASRTITFELLGSGLDESPRFLLRDDWISQPEDSKTVLQSTETVVETLPPEYKEYADYLSQYLDATQRN